MVQKKESKKQSGSVISNGPEERKQSGSAISELNRIDTQYKINNNKINRIQAIV